MQARVQFLRRLFPALAALLVALCFSARARADGFIVIHNPPPSAVPGHFAFAPLEVSYHRVNVQINDQVASTTVDQEFYNPNGQRLEGTYLFPLPEGAHIDKFQMDINGHMQEAELLDSGKARSLYEEIVRKTKDPALLEYAGRDAFKVRIFPIEPNSRKQIKITYTQLLKSDSGLTEYTYPLNTEKFSSRPLRDVSVKVSLHCKESLKSVYSPSHSVETRRDGEHAATVGWEARNVRPDTDFKVLFSRTEKPLSVDLLTYKTSSQDGYFLLLASPGMEAPKGAVQKKDVCFVIDTSGSMAENGGKKMEQAKKALSFCLQNLNEGDRFEVIRFSTEAEPLFDKLVDADREHVARAQEFVGKLKPIGGTAISDALGKAMALRGKRASGTGGAGAAAGETDDPKSSRLAEDRADRPYIVIFLTDGQPTIGETNEDNIVAAMNRATEGTTRVFSFGIGTDVNTHLLDRLADQTRAFSQYVLPDEDLEVKLSNFYTKIKEPVLANVKVDFTGARDVKVSQLYPNRMPDLFKGDMLVLFGRYSGSGPGAVRISGTLNGERHEFASDVRFTDGDQANGFIPRLWATRRVGYLLDEIRLHGENRELKDEVTRLAREHGIVTPYTAYLILEDEQRRNVPVTLRSFQELDRDGAVRERAAGRWDSTRAEAKDAERRAGDMAVANAQDLSRLKNGQSLEDAQFGTDLAKRPAAAAAQPAQAGASGARGAGGFGGGAPGPVSGATATATQPDNYGYRSAQNYTQQARVVKGRAFYQNGNTWTDATAQERLAKDKNLKQRQVKFNSDEYFALLAKYPEAAAWFSLGNEVDVMLGEELVMVR
jgi:Ca-activated chloride channel family protein